jgi:hypothetical protein
VRSGQPVGRVEVVLRRSGRLYLVVRRGSVFHRDLRAVGWDAVAFVRDADFVVGLTVPAREIDEMPRLSPRLAVKSREAEATRVTSPPAASPPGQVPFPRPAERAYLPALFLVALGLLALLAVFLLASLPSWLEWEYGLFAVPAAFFALALAIAYLRSGVAHPESARPTRAHR